MSSEKTTRRYELRKRAESMEATRRRITEAAVELHRTVGPARTTMTAVAQSAGVQRQPLYRHFADEGELLGACSGHFAALHPSPDTARWRTIADPAERLRVGLDELYTWYEATGTMWARVLRDETLVAAVTTALIPFRAFLDDAAQTLAAGWGVRGRRRELLLAATRHAVDFHTWESLAGEGGVGRDGVVELTSAMVGRAVGE